MKITKGMGGIKVKGHVGTWYVIGTVRRKNDVLFLLEHETYGDMAACLIVDKDGDLVMDDVFNGFDDYDEANPEQEADEEEEECEA